MAVSLHRVSSCVAAILDLRLGTADTCWLPTRRFPVCVWSAFPRVGGPGAAAAEAPDSQRSRSMALTQPPTVVGRTDFE